MFSINLKPKFGGIILIDISGFTQMKLNLNDKEWLNIMQNFYHIADDVIALSNNLINIKLLGDGILMTSTSYSPKEWFNFINKIYYQSMSWFFSNKNNYLEGVSVVGGYGSYYEVQDKDVIGLDIDELFLIEKYATLNRIAISKEFYELLGLDSFQKKITNPISYLNNLKIDYYEFDSI